MYSFKQLSLLILLFLLSPSCTSKLPQLEGVDLKLWKEDRNGCNHFRATMIDAIDAEKEKLKRLSEMDLVELLGRPDENELLDRNQKFFIYFLEPGPPCDVPTAHAKKLILRINAMGLAKETLIK